MIEGLTDLIAETPICADSIWPREVATSRVWLIAIDPGTGSIERPDGSINIVYEAKQSQN